MSDFTDTAEDLVIGWVIGNVVTQPTAPLQLALTTTLPTDSTAGTEVTGGSYTRESITFGSVSGGLVSNSALVRFDNMPTATIVGAEVWDSTSPTPVRLLWKAFSKSTTAGDALEFAIGDIDFTVA